MGAHFMPTNRRGVFLGDDGTVIDTTGYAMPDFNANLQPDPAADAAASTMPVGTPVTLPTFYSSGSGLPPPDPKYAGGYSAIPTGATVSPTGAIVYPALAPQTTAQQQATLAAAAGKHDTASIVLAVGGLLLVALLMRRKGGGAPAASPAL